MELNAASAASEFLAARPAKAIEPNPHASFESADRRVVPKDERWERFERISVGGGEVQGAGVRLANVSEVHAGEKHVRDPSQPLRGILLARTSVV